jgi:hypothetical protein
MLVTTRNNDNTATTYGFDPEHASEVIGFYTKQYWAGKIQGFTATLDNGIPIAMGQVGSN